MDKLTLVRLIRKANIIYLPSGLTIKNIKGTPDIFTCNWFEMISKYELETYDVHTRILTLRLR
jgi:hypothetical protein